MSHSGSSSSDSARELPNDFIKMAPELRREAEEIFTAITKLPLEERAAYLDQACAGNAGLKREVSSLLAATEVTRSFLFTSAQKEGAAVPANQLPDLLIDHYQIERKLGEGGMGEVYLARDLKLGRLVAIKMLPQNYIKDANRVGRFHQEARTVSALNHPNIVTIFEIVETDKYQSIVTEYINGMTLKEYLHKGSVTLVEKLNIALQVCGALGAAHNSGIVHRDIKPDNIMIRQDGYVKVLDFGLAKLLEQSSNPEQSVRAAQGLSHPGIIMGTAKYMSPEQARGQQIDIRTDIFSMGVLLYEMITGHQPFTGETDSDVIAAILTREPEVPSAYLPQIPAKLNDIVVRAMRKPRDERYQTIQEMFTELQDVKWQLEQRSSMDGLSEQTEENRKDSRTDEKIAAPTGSLSRRSFNELLSIPGRSRGMSLVALSSMIILAGLIVGVVLTYGFGKSALSRPQPLFEKLQLTKLATQGRAYQSVVSGDGRYVAYVSTSAEGLSLWVRQIATNSTLQITPPKKLLFWSIKFSPDSNYIYYLTEDPQNPARGMLYQVPSLGGASRKICENLLDFSFSPDGREVTFVRLDDKRGESYVMICDHNGNERTIASCKDPDQYGRVAWSPDGRLLAAVLINNRSDRRFYTIVGLPLDGGKKEIIMRPERVYPGVIQWLSDGSGLIINGKDPDRGNFQIWQLGYPGGQLQRITNDFIDYYGASITADSKQLISSVGQQMSNVWSVPADNPEKARPITSGFAHFDHITTGTDGRIYYIAKIDSLEQIYSMRADGRDQRQLTFGPENNSMPTVSPDGRYLAYVSKRNGLRNIWRMDLSTGSREQLTRGFDDCLPVFSPDGSTIYYVSYVSSKWTAWQIPAAGGEASQLAEMEMGASTPSPSPDGKLIAFEYVNTSEGSSGIVILDRKGDVVKTIPGVSSRSNIRWSGNGESITYISPTPEHWELWDQPIDGSAPRQITNFNGDDIFWFDWTKDGKEIICARGSFSSDVVILSDSHR